MSNSDQKKTERFRPRLERSLRELQTLRETTAQNRAAVELDQQSVGRLSRMDAMQAQQMAVAADRQRQVQIARIEGALKRMEEGEFGYCAECGTEIPDKRLEADPSAHLCVTCAAAKDK
jgi:DnaK suppressor protein